MEAIVKDSYKWNSVVAFTGREFIKREWRPVPSSHIDEAVRGHPFLSFRETEETTDTRANDEIDVTASALELANENGILLRDVIGTGNKGKIVKKNVADFIDARR